MSVWTRPLRPHYQPESQISRKSKTRRADSPSLVLSRQLRARTNSGIHLRLMRTRRTNCASWHLLWARMRSLTCIAKPHKVQASPRTAGHPSFAMQQRSNIFSKADKRGRTPTNSYPNSLTSRKVLVQLVQQCQSSSPVPTRLAHGIASLRILLR